MVRGPERQRRRSAATLVETTFIALVCFTFMFALFEYGRVVMMLQLMNNAARTGARQAVVTPTSYVNPATATSTVVNTTTAALAGQGLIARNGNPLVSVYQADTAGNNIGPWTSAPFGRNIVVQIDGDYPLLFPTFGFLPRSGNTPNSIHLTATVMMRGEAN
jgi:Flp pilus assembly protein TadG